MRPPRKIESAHDVVPVPHVQVPLPFIYDTRLTPEQKIVFLAIAARCGVHGYTVVSVEDLAKDLGMNERTLFRRLNELSSSGWITVDRRGNGKTSEKEPVKLASKYVGPLYRYPYYFLRYGRTPEELNVLHSTSPMGEETYQKLTMWLGERGIEVEGREKYDSVVQTCQPCHARPDRSDRSDGADLTAASVTEVDQDPEEVDQEGEEVVASLPIPAPEFGQGAPDPDKNSKRKETLGEDVVQTESSSPPSDHADAPVSSRVTDLRRIADEAAARTREEQTRKLRKSLEKEQKVANLGGKPVPISLKKQLQGMEKVWREEMERLYPGLTFAAWGPKERGICKALLEKYSGQLLLTALQYVVREWKALSERFVKGHGVPTLGFLQRFHDTLFLEAQRWDQVRAVRDEWDDWFVKNPNRSPPTELVERYQRVKGL